MIASQTWKDAGPDLESNSNKLNGWISFSVTNDNSHHINKCILICITDSQGGVQLVNTGICISKDSTNN